jgi:DNA-binding NarL/FixJ family response regulator
LVEHSTNNLEGYVMRVLLVDDHVWLRSALRLLLEQETGLEVVGEVSDASLLLDQMAQVHPNLLLLDWELPMLRTVTMLVRAPITMKIDPQIAQTSS